MDEREFLGKIRRLQESGKKINVTDFPVNKKQKGMTQLMVEESEPLQLLFEEDIQTLDPEEQREEECR